MLYRGPPLASILCYAGRTHFLDLSYGIQEGPAFWVYLMLYREYHLLGLSYGTQEERGAPLESISYASQDYSPLGSRQSPILRGILCSSNSTGHSVIPGLLEDMQ